MFPAESVIPVKELTDVRRATKTRRFPGVLLEVYAVAAADELFDWTNPFAIQCSSKIKKAVFFRRQSDLFRQKMPSDSDEQSSQAQEASRKFHCIHSLRSEPIR